MKASFTFDLENPDDRKAHLRHTHSLDMALTLFSIQTELIKTCERAQESGKTIDVVDLVRTTLGEIFEESLPIRLEDLID